MKNFCDLTMVRPKRIVGDPRDPFSQRALKPEDMDSSIASIDVRFIVSISPVVKEFAPPLAICSVLTTIHEFYVAETREEVLDAMERAAGLES